MKHLDLFSGYGGFTISARKHGVETIGFSEVDKYACQVLNYHFSEVRNYGDITKINFKQFNGEVDIITGGSPCQDLSVAGKQRGLSGERSGLFFEFVRAINDAQPAYFIWENVKGALSSNNGWDFARVQIEMEQAGYAIQWVVLNAKDFGVPQNRERVFVIGTRIGSEREVLPLRESSRQALRELTSRQSQGYRVYDPSGVSTALASQAGGIGAKTGLYVQHVNRTKCEYNLRTTDISGSLTASMYKGVNASGKTGVAVPVLTPERLEKRQNGRRFKENGEPAFSLTAQDRHGVFNGYRIRRLTPVECERLMGLEDNWTSCDGAVSDTQRYKLCGNGVVVNCVDYLLGLLIKEKSIKFINRLI